MRRFRSGVCFALAAIIATTAFALAGGFSLRVHNESDSWMKVSTFKRAGSRPPGPGEITSETICVAPHSTGEKTIAISVEGVHVYAIGRECYGPDRNIATLRMSGSSGTVTVTGSGSSISAR